MGVVVIARRMSSSTVSTSIPTICFQTRVLSARGCVGVSLRRPPPPAPAHKGEGSRPSARHLQSTTTTTDILSPCSPCSPRVGVALLGGEIEVADAVVGRRGEPDAAVLVEEEVAHAVVGKGMGYSVTLPVAGSSRPITSRHSDEYQTERSGAMPSAYGLVLALGSAYSLKVSVLGSKRSILPLS